MKNKPKLNEISHNNNVVSHNNNVLLEYYYIQKIQELYSEIKMSIIIDIYIFFNI